MAPSTEIATLDRDALLATYPALDPDSDALEVIQENLEGEEIGMTDLTRITMPTGNSRSWTVPTLSGEEHLPSIRGIIVVWSKRRTFFRTTKLDGTPPACWSTDGKFADPGGAFASPEWAAEPFVREDEDEPSVVPGAGWELPKLGLLANPSGECSSCPANEWGTSLKGGRGKACGEYRSLYLLRPGSVLPSIVSIPATSLQALKAFLIGMAAESIPHYGAIVDLGLEVAETGGQSHARVVPSLVQRLEGDSLASARAAKATFAKMLAQVDTARVVQAETAPVDDSAK